MNGSPRNPSRRDIFRAGLAMGAGFALSRLPMPLSEALAAQQELPLILKKVPSSGEMLPVVGVGTNRFSTNPPELVERLRVVIRRMPEIGTKVIDTANGYGSSERVIGELSKELANRDKLFVATKAGPRDPATATNMVEGSFRALQTDKIDLYFVHNMNGTDFLIPMLKELKQAGRIRYLGISISSDGNYGPLEEVMRREPLDFIEIDYSITNTNSDERLLQLALDRGMAVLNNVPFNSRGGALITALEGKPLPPFAAEIDVKSWAQYLLKYNVSHPAITCAIPGTTRIEHLEENNGAARGRLPDEAMRKRMHEYFTSVAG